MALARADANRRWGEAVATARQDLHSLNVTVKYDSGPTHASSQRTLASSSSAPVLARHRDNKANMGLSRSLLMAGSELSLGAPPSAATPSKEQLSPLACAARLRQQLSSSSSLGNKAEMRSLGGSRDKAGAALRALERENRLKECSEHLAAQPRFALRGDEEAEAAIEARLREKGDAWNPFARFGSSGAPAMSIEQVREKERLKEMRRVARSVREARQRGELLPSEIPYDDRRDQVIMRRINREMETMVHKVSKARNSYQDVTRIPGGAEKLCKSVVMKDYFLDED